MSHDAKSLLESARSDFKNGYTVRAGTRLRQAADKGFHEAIYELSDLVLAKRIPGTDREIRQRLENVSVPSANLARLRASLRYDGFGDQTDRDGALRDLNFSAEQGHPLSIAEVAILWSELTTEFDRQASQTWFARLAEQSVSRDVEVRYLLSAVKQLQPAQTISPLPLLKTWPPPNRAQLARNPLSEEPEIYVVPNLLSPLECAWLCDAAAAYLNPSQIYDSVTGTTRTDPTRSSDAMYFRPGNSSPLTSRIIGNILSTVNQKGSHAEPMAILRYQYGQEYKPHYDWISQSSMQHDPLRHAGQRISTALVYLNTPIDGGETIFPLLDLRIEPRQGTLLYFSSMDSFNRPAKSTLHAGGPVREGEKWISSLWIREREIGS